MDRERTDAVWKKYGRSLWNFAGSYGLGIALMLILLVLTFAGTLHQVRLSSAMGSEAAIESFFGAAYVLIPLGGENSLISLPLPGMGITCVLLFANLLIGRVFGGLGGTQACWWLMGEFCCCWPASCWATK